MDLIKPPKVLRNGGVHLVGQRSIYGSIHNMDMKIHQARSYKAHMLEYPDSNVKPDAHVMPSVRKTAEEAIVASNADRETARQLILKYKMSRADVVTARNFMLNENASRADKRIA